MAENEDKKLEENEKEKKKEKTPEETLEFAKKIYKERLKREISECDEDFLVWLIRQQMNLVVSYDLEFQRAKYFEEAFGKINNEFSQFKLEVSKHYKKIII